MAIGTAYIDRVFADAGGYTGNTYYYRLVLKSEASLYIWDHVAKALSLTTVWANSVVAMPENGTNGQYPVVIPAELPAGTYEVTVYLQAGSTPQNSDNVQDTYQLKHGSIFGF